MNHRHLTIFLAIVLCVLTVHAQSGRRQPKTSSPAPVPTPTPEPTPTPKVEDKEDELAFFLGADHGTAFTYFPVGYYDAVLRGCADQLRAGSSASVEVTQRAFSRGDAIKKAKEETKTYVVSLSLSADSMTNPNSSAYGDIELDFVVFAPQTAKVLISGKSYQNLARRGPLVVGPRGRGTTSPIYRERLLEEAGKDAGKRILKALGAAGRSSRQEQVISSRGRRQAQD